MPYRIDVRDPPDHAFETLIDLGALDLESGEQELAALMPDAISPDTVAGALGVSDFRVSPAVGHDDESVWTLSPRSVHTRTLRIVPVGMAAPPGALRIVDARAFGTGLHPTTRLCVEAMEDLLDASMPERVLDIGTGSGILALAALRRGVARAVGVDLDRDALLVAAENARLNDLAGRLTLVRGGPDAVLGSWPLVVANIRAAELIAMTSTLALRLASRGRLILSGIPRSVAPDVERACRRVGMTQVSVTERGGWTALVFRPSW
jgi:ribosomal protein L11 methylase PrmA